MYFTYVLHILHIYYRYNMVQLSDYIYIELCGICKSIPLCKNICFFSTLQIRRCSSRFSRTQAAPFVGMEDPGSPSERIASSFTGSASKLTWKPCQVRLEWAEKAKVYETDRNVNADLVDGLIQLNGCNIYLMTL